MSRDVGLESADVIGEATTFVACMVSDHQISCTLDQTKELINESNESVTAIEHQWRIHDEGRLVFIRNLSDRGVQMIVFSSKEEVLLQTLGTNF